MSTTPLVVINIVGLTPSMLGEQTPNLNKLVSDGFSAPLSPVFPAVTTTAQATMLTGKMPSEHGIVGNGWYYEDLAEVKFWQQPNSLIQAEKVWHKASRNVDDFTCSQLFWWYNMYADVDYSATPRPIYPADGRKLPGLYTQPKELYRSLEDTLGPFPFFNFWGPTADIRSSSWIAACAKEIFDKNRPTLQLVYLPHLDYNLQRLGPNDPAIAEDIRSIDKVAGDLIAHVREGGADVLVVSEYGIEQVDHCVHINRILREQGYLAVRDELSWEMLDCGASRAFAVADHQAAHVYIKDPRDIEPLRQLLSSIPGIQQVLGEEEKSAIGLNHSRAGDLVLMAESGSWFSYYFWLDDSKAPDYARTVDIHRKPGYDPVELFVDPKLRIPMLKIGWRLLQKKLGVRMLMDVVPLDASLVKGSHGRLTTDPQEGPIIIGSRTDLQREHYAMQDIQGLILAHWQ